jgi:hypothetical protein
MSMDKQYFEMLAAAVVMAATHTLAAVSKPEKK